MNDIEKSIYEGAGAKCLRMYLAWQQLSLANNEFSDVIHKWLTAIPVPLNYLDSLTETTQVSVSADLRRLTWRSDGDSSYFISKIVKFMKQVGVSTQSLHELSELGDKLQPDRLGSWLEIRSNSLDSGWYFPENLPLITALDLAPYTTLNQQIRDWGDKHNITTCSLVGKSIGAGYPYTDILISISSDQPKESLTIVSDLFDTLKFSLPNISNIITTQNNLILSLWLTHEGLAKIGVMIPDTTTDMIIKSCYLAGINNDDDLAAFQGVLQEDRPCYVEIQQVADGLGVELHYQLDNIWNNNDDETL